LQPSRSGDQQLSEVNQRSAGTHTPGTPDRPDSDASSAIDLWNQRREDATLSSPSGEFSGVGLLAAAGGKFAVAGSRKARQCITIANIKEPARN